MTPVLPKPKRKQKHRRPPPTITFLPSWNDQAAETWIKVFRMKNQKKVAAFLDQVDAHDDGLHPIAYQMEQGVRYL